MTANLRLRLVTGWRRLVEDQLYRGSLLLLTNTATLSALGFLFWTLAARQYPAADVGFFSALTSGVSLLAAVAGLGLPNTIIRRLSNTTNQRQLILAAATATVIIGGVLTLLTVLFLGPVLPPTLHLSERGVMTFVVAGLVLLTAMGAVLDAGLVAVRATGAVLVKNLLGSIVKIVVVLLFTAFGAFGLLTAYGTGVALSLLLGGIALGRRLHGGARTAVSFHRVRRHMLSTAGNYVATVVGILPISVVPLEVLVVRGPAQTAQFAIAFMLVGFLNFIPATSSQVLFAEASRRGVTLSRQLRKALRWIYSLLAPSIFLLIVAAPFILRIFGDEYSAGATTPFRILALSTILTAGSYVVDAVLIARDRLGAYLFMNGANSAFVLLGVALLLPRGLTAAAVGWTLAVALSLILGLMVLATGRTGRHHLAVSSAQTGRADTRAVLSDLQGATPVNIKGLVDPQVRELLASWPTMPTTVIAEQIGWDHPIRHLLDRVIELRSDYVTVGPIRTSCQPGEVAECGLWFPPVEVPTGGGQVRVGARLPVLTMVSVYSRWLSAVLVPSTATQDLTCGFWQLFEQLGTVPQRLVWHDEYSVGGPEDDIADESVKFFSALGTQLMLNAETALRGESLIGRALIYMERSFLADRTFVSPADFNRQLAAWVKATNTMPRQRPHRSPAERITRDRQAMLPLPSKAPDTGWHMPARLCRSNYFHFDSNEYSLPSAASERVLEVVADLAHVRVLCDGRAVAIHKRSWAAGETITDPAHTHTA